MSPMHNHVSQQQPDQRDQRSCTKPHAPQPAETWKRHRSHRELAHLSAPLSCDPTMLAHHQHTAPSIAARKPLCNRRCRAPTHREIHGCSTLAVSKLNTAKRAPRSSCSPSFLATKPPRKAEATGEPGLVSKRCDAISL